MQVMQRILSVAQGIVLPMRCLSCGDALLEAGLCAGCWGRVQFIARPYCDRCALPFPFPAGAELSCGQCLADPPPWQRGRAVMVYNDISRDLVLGFKYGDRLDFSPLFGVWLARAAGDLLGENDIIVPVPSHWRSVLVRRYNQAAELARAVRRVSELPVVWSALRKRHTQRTRGLNRRQRAVSLRNAFALASADRVRGARVLVVDDVMTTGATLHAVARTLLQGGARSVDVVVLVRRL